MPQGEFSGFLAFFQPLQPICKLRSRKPEHSRGRGEIAFRFVDRLFEQHDLELIKSHDTVEHGLAQALAGFPLVRVQRAVPVKSEFSRSLALIRGEEMINFDARSRRSKN